MYFWAIFRVAVFSYPVGGQVFLNPPHRKMLNVAVLPESPRRFGPNVFDIEFCKERFFPSNR